MKLLFPLIVTVVLAGGSAALAQDADPSERKERMLQRYDQLAETASSCVTDPCPVTRATVSILGTSYDAIEVNLPEERVIYVVVESGGERFMAICHYENYVEASGTCYLI